MGAPLSATLKKIPHKFDIRLARTQRNRGWSIGRIAEASGYSVQFVTSRLKQPGAMFKGGYGAGILTVGKPDRLLEGLFREHSDRVQDGTAT